MKRYRVVTTTRTKDGRVETDIGCEWKYEKLAKAEMKALALKHSNVLYSLQKENR